MAKRRATKAIPRITRSAAMAALGALRAPTSTVGEKANYNFQPEVTEYQLWPFSTIEWVADQSRYRARVIVQNKTTQDMVAFNSWHQDFSDAQRAIALVSDSLNGVGERKVYNIWAETIEVHTSDIGGGTIVNVIEAQALIWSMQS